MDMVAYLIKEQLGYHVQNDFRHPGALFDHHESPGLLEKLPVSGTQPDVQGVGVAHPTASPGDRAQDLRPVLKSGVLLDEAVPKRSLRGVEAADGLGQPVLTPHASVAGKSQVDV